MDIRGSQPPIWRGVVAWSDMSLADLHHVIQVIFDWSNAHRWRFSLGRDPFDRSSQVFLCPEDAEDREPSEADSPEAHDVRIDEVLQFRGDVLHYVYDYADSWDIRIMLLQVRQESLGLEHPLIITGGRAAPPEDCGGLRTAEELAGIVPKPEFFDSTRLNEELVAAFQPPLDMLGVPIRLVELGIMLGTSDEAPDHGQRISRLIQDPRVMELWEFESSIAGISWFLDRAAEGGIPLTASGYIKPDEVVAACQAVPRVRKHRGKHNREVNEPEVLRLREALQRVGLLRKVGSRLVLTGAGRAAQGDAESLRRHLIERVIPVSEGFEQDATMLFLLHAATTRWGTVDGHRIARVLSKMGYRAGDREVWAKEVYSIPVVRLLGNVAEATQLRSGLGDGFPVSQTASMLAREILLQSGFGPED